MGTILVSKRGELDPNKGFEIEHSKIIRRDGFGDIRIRKHLVWADFLTREEDVDRVAGLGGGTVQEQVSSGSVLVNKAGLLECGPGGRKVVAADEDIDIAGVANGRFEPERKDLKMHRSAQETSIVVTRLEVHSMVVCELE